MSRQKNKPMWILFLVLLIVFLAGMACEFVLKYVTALFVSQPGDPGHIVTNRILRMFGDEALPLWAIPTMLLNWMLVMPHDVTAYALRWIPYLCAFLLPVLCALIRHKSIPLILCAIEAGIAAVGIVLIQFLTPHPYISVYVAIPFGAELLLLVLACIALGAKKKGLAVFTGILCLLCMLLSPVASVLLNKLLPGMPWHAYFPFLLRHLEAYAASPWPIYKAFAFLMYALILFGAASKFKKKA